MIVKAIYFSLIQISRSLGLHFFSGGGGSCRRQGKSAAPSGRRGERVGRGSITALFLAKYSRKRDRRGRGGMRTSFPAPRPPPRFCGTCRRKWRVRVCVRRCAQHAGFRPLLDLPLFLPVLLTILHRFPLGFMDSATSDFRPLTFSFRFEPFVSSSERNVFPPLSETFRFFERLQ